MKRHTSPLCRYATEDPRGPSLLWWFLSALMWTFQLWKVCAACWFAASHWAGSCLGPSKPCQRRKTHATVCRYTAEEYPDTSDLVRPGALGGSSTHFESHLYTNSFCRSLCFVCRFWVPLKCMHRQCTKGSHHSVLGDREQIRSTSETYGLDCLPHLHIDVC